MNESSLDDVEPGDYSFAGTRFRVIKSKSGSHELKSGDRVFEVVKVVRKENDLHLTVCLGSSLVEDKLTPM